MADNVTEAVAVKRECPCTHGPGPAHGWNCCADLLSVGPHHRVRTPHVGAEVLQQLQYESWPEEQTVVFCSPRQIDGGDGATLGACIELPAMSE